ncbi:invasion protein IalB [Roseinatronobacter thiooxidans]|uniref:Invasion protein IalB n=1 Tax=Roseinatronobacter thiooxidans TaxID=121821 RepID=A0A2W7QLH8_9RHOB|nr:invasion associated locus B family protein [Roseinatronobacter thiooxidans]PZX48156.1 invasion protein IalB [Roseinatronobacter thiooxidans]
MAQWTVGIIKTTMAAAAFTLSASSLFAQTSEAADSPLTGLSTGEIITQENDESYVGNTHGDWELVCVRIPDEQDPCQMYQLLRDGEGNATAEITVFPLPPGQEAAAGATILTPLDTLLTAQLVMQVDNGDAKRYPFTFCTAIGCIARVGFTAAEVDAFRRGATATWSLVPVAAPDQVVNLNMSLIGFTAAFAELNEQLGE